MVSCGTQTQIHKHPTQPPRTSQTCRADSTVAPTCTHVLECSRSRFKYIINYSRTSRTPTYSMLAHSHTLNVRTPERMYRIRAPHQKHDIRVFSVNMQSLARRNPQSATPRNNQKYQQSYPVAPRVMRRAGAWAQQPVGAAHAMHQTSHACVDASALHYILYSTLHRRV